MKEITRDEWLAEAKRLFGDNTENWAFECPECHRIQSAKTIREQIAENTPSMRFGIPKKGDPMNHMVSCYSPNCNYAANGLFHSGILVIIEPELPHDANRKINCQYVFPFANQEEK